jgi:hypothetical protein
MSLIALMFILTPFIIKAESDDNFNEVYKKTFGSESNQNLYDIIETEDGNYLIVGNTFGDVPVGEVRGKTKGYIIKADIDGNKIWEKEYTFSVNNKPDNYTYFNGVQKVDDGGFIIVGSYIDPENDLDLEAIILKIDKDGKLEWQKTYSGGPKSIDKLQSIIKTSDGNYVIAGYTGGNIDGNINLGINDGWIIKIDKTGKELFSKQYGTNANDKLYAIKETEDGDYVAVGETAKDSTNLNDGWIIKIDKNGNEIYNKSFGSSNYNDCFYDLIINDDNIMVVGEKGRPLSNDNKIINASGWLVKLDNDGNIIYEKQFGDDSFVLAQSITKINGTDYAIVGQTSGTDFGDSDNPNVTGFLMIINEDGDAQLVRRYGTDRTGDGIITFKEDFFSKIIKTKDNNLVIVGSFECVSDDDLAGKGWLLTFRYGYQLKLDSNEGKSDIDKLSTKYQEELLLPNSSFTREGYQLIGWATSLEEANNLVVKYQDSYTQSDKVDHILYAVWKKADVNPDPNKEIINKTIITNTDNKKQSLPKTGIDNNILLISTILITLSIGSKVIIKRNYK